MKKPAVHVVTCSRCGRKDKPQPYPDYLLEGWVHASDGKFCRGRCAAWRLRQ